MDPQRNQKNQQLRRSCCQTHKPHAQHGGCRAGGRECHTQQSETKMDLQTVRRSAAERDAEPLRRATVGKPIDIFSSKSAEYVRRMANSVACLPHPPSPTPADVSRCAGTHIPNSHGAPARTPDPHRNGSTKKHTPPKLQKSNTLYRTLGEFVPTVLEQGLIHPRPAGAAPEHAPCVSSICPAVTGGGSLARDV